MNEAAKVLRRERRLLEISQVELAAMLGVGKSYIGHVEGGRMPFNEEHVAKLPEPIRSKVAAVFVEEHQAAIERLRDG